ncbi:MAG: DUF2235 domain-containing protein [Lentisphaeraceae bacterium]|nr:DUF2235 domain-containing protein [Lentisphaeraceae bacterium]
MIEKRNLVIAFDGTGNEPDLNDDGINTSSNVVKFKNALMNKRSKPTVCIYEQGVGTKYGEYISGNLFGVGVEDRIQSAYRQLQNYLTDESCADNRIFIIGFSRGAYSARRFASLLNCSGIPKNGDDWSKGWNNFLEVSDDADGLKKSGDFFEVKVDMLGVWDTVKAAPTIPDRDDQKLPENVAAAYHAISIDEQRDQFQVTRFNADQRVTEMWFPGVHSDVGGGYTETGLSDVSLSWMIDNACNHDLDFKGSYINSDVNPDCSATLHDSLADWPLGKITREIQTEDLLHETVKERITSVQIYNPGNVPQSSGMQV